MQDRAFMSDHSMWMFTTTGGLATIEHFAHIALLSAAVLPANCYLGDVQRRTVVSMGACYIIGSFEPAHAYSQKR